METGRSRYTLDPWQFKQTLAILRREQEASTPSARQEKIFRLLNSAFYAFGVTWLITFLLFVITFSGLDFVEARHRVFLTLYGIALLVLLAGAAGITTLFLLSLPYVRWLLRQRKLARQTGLWEALRAPWCAERSRHKWRNLSDAGVLIVGLFVAATTLVFSVVALAIRERVLLAVDLLLFVAGGVIVATFLMRRNRERLGVTSRLYSSLEGYRQESRHGQDARIEIPPEDYEKIAQIERAQIARDRVQSILGGPEQAEAPPYAVYKSRTARQGQARLDTLTRFRVQDRIDALMAEPHPGGVLERPEAGAYRLRVPETPVIIGYTVDDQARRIQILSVKSACVTEAWSEPREE